ncbi:uncharacterized protein J7T54_001585 [Emericellopsis cladophorae]|uniref:Uncharacterized protein n=1 Tax=Emericellopsis cladophorae TaxID=2686198 RepID=A0A9Q0BGT9_9HYPO|nr:uncharacterized protein J7T54_001585 [Emericellopsis cladophorae]KAI6783709.1 hypothetical protein J7T54_001585 [Emericellopsis cladophorae]
MTKQFPDPYNFLSDEGIKPLPALYPSVSVSGKNTSKELDELAKDPEVANMPESSDRKHTSSEHGENVDMSEIPTPPVIEFNHQLPLRRVEISGRDLKSSNEIINVDAEEAEETATVSAIHSIVTDMRSMMTRSVQYSTRDISELKQKLSEATRERNMAVEHAKSGHERNKELQRELQAQKEAFEELRAAHTKALRDKSRLNRLGNSLKTSDSAIQEAWGQLSYAITNLACCLAKGKPDMTHMEDVRLALRHVLLNDPREMDDEGGRQRMIRMFLWRVARKWWPCGGKPSGTKTAKTWKSLRAGMLVAYQQDEERMKSVLQWFATGWGFVEDTVSHPQHMQDFVETLEGQLRLFLKHREDETRSQMRLERDLTDMFDMLKQLESIFYGAKCIYQPVFRFVPLEEPHLYDEEFVEAVDTTKPPSPASKAKTVVVKAEVVLE